MCQDGIYILERKETEDEDYHVEDLVDLWEIVTVLSQSFNCQGYIF